MSFSSEVKAELCRTLPAKRCCALAECFGILLYCNTFSASQIKIITESGELAQRLPRLFRKAFGLDFDVQAQNPGSPKRQLLITAPEKLSRILESYGFSPDGTLSLHVNLGALEEDCCKGAFLRGGFLAGGSVTDPQKGYHLELLTTHRAVSRETYALMDEVLGFYPKATGRSGGCVLYLKQSNQIEDFLTRIGAPVCAMKIMEAKVEKELTNKVNRCCNCDEANTSKVVEAAQRQLAAIRALEQTGRLRELGPKLYAAALARLENPEANLTELGQMMDPPVTKSTMNHRLKQLAAMAQKGEGEA